MPRARVDQQPRARNPWPSAGRPHCPGWPRPAAARQAKGVGLAALRQSCSGPVADPRCRSSAIRPSSAPEAGAEVMNVTWIKHAIDRPNNMELRRTECIHPIGLRLSDLAVLEARGDLGKKDVTAPERGVSSLNLPKPSVHAGSRCPALGYILHR